VSPLGLFRERVPQVRPAVAEVDRLKAATALDGPHYVPGWDGGGTPTTDYNAAWSEAAAAHERGERNAGVTHCIYGRQEWVASAPAYQDTCAPGCHEV
jgi:hypothetical protein